MAKTLRLDERFFEPYRGMLSKGVALGPLLAASTDLREGRLSVWVPESFDTVEPRDLWNDVLKHKDSFGVQESMCQFFDQELRKSNSRLLIADTYGTPENDAAKQIETPWFYLDSVGVTTGCSICVFITGGQAKSSAYDKIMNEACPYPRIFIITSNQSEEPLKTGEHLANESEVLRGLINRVEHILLGVFDDRSFMIWSR